MKAWLNENFKGSLALALFFFVTLVVAPIVAVTCGLLWLVER